MTMGRRRTERRGGADRRRAVAQRLDLTSMIDVVFLLLVFFLATSTFRPDERSLSSWLPRDRGEGTDRVVVDPGCRVQLTRDGGAVRCRADDHWIGAVRGRFEETFGGVGPDFAGLEDHLRLRRDHYRGVAASGMPVVIDAADRVPSHYVVQVIDICRKLGVEEVLFAVPERPE